MHLHPSPSGRRPSRKVIPWLRTLHIILYIRVLYSTDMYEAVLVLYMHAYSYSTALEERDRGGGDGGDDELAKCGCGKEVSWLLE